MKDDKLKHRTNQLLIEKELRESLIEAVNAIDAGDLGPARNLLAWAWRWGSRLEDPTAVRLRAAHLAGAVVLLAEAGLRARYARGRLRRGLLKEIGEAFADAEQMQGGQGESDTIEVRQALIRHLHREVVGLLRGRR